MIFQPKKFGLPIVNRKILGKFKDECLKDLMIEFVGVKAKTYCIVKENDNIKKIKGINKADVANEVSILDYKNCINDCRDLYTTYRVFNSKKHIPNTHLLKKMQNQISNSYRNRGILFHVINMHNYIIKQIL